MADAVYAIQVDAAFSDDATPQLDSFTSALVEAGKKSDAYASAVRRLSSDLDVARAASAAANAELATGRDRYSELERSALAADRAVERAGAKGPELASSLEKANQAAAEYRQFIAALGVPTQEQVDRLRALELSASRAGSALAKNAAAQPKLAAAAAEARSALDAYSAELRPLEQNAERAAAAQKALEDELARVNKIAGAAEQRNALLNQRFEKMGQAVSFLPGPFRSLGEVALRAARANQGLTSVFGSQTAVAALAVVGVLAVAAAVVALTAALVSGAVAFTRYAAVTADAHRSAELSREAFAALSPETAAAAASFDRITEATGQSQERLTELTRQLRDAKVSAANMPAALRAAALAETALGKGGAAEFVAQIKDGTLSVAAFAAQAQSKFGPIVSRQLLGLTAQGERFKRLWDSLFDGLNLAPILNSLDFLLADLERGAPLAEFLRQAFGGLFGIVSDNAQSAAVAIEAFALQVAIWMTRAYIVARENLEGIKTALDLTAAVFDFATGDVVGGVQRLQSAIEREAPNLAAAGTAAGSNVVLGLIDALTGNPLGLLDVVQGLMGSVVGAAKDALGIHSPSRVFAEIGENTAAGFSEGVDAGASGAQGSMANLVAPGPAVTPAPAAAAQAATGAGGARIDLSGATFTFHGIKDAEHAADKIGEALTAILRGDVESLRGATV